VSEDNQWRQLGSIVNSVLMEARSKAIRKGTLSQAAPQQTSGRSAQSAGGFVRERAGNGFLGESLAAIKPVQLELPFGIAAGLGNEFGSARSPRGVRLM
jgi:hypothetical protein